MAPRPSRHPLQECLIARLDPTFPWLAAREGVPALSSATLYEGNDRIRDGVSESHPQVLPAAGPHGPWPQCQPPYCLVGSPLKPADPPLPPVLRRWEMAAPAALARLEIGRRRVGKECRSRWSPYH